MPRPVKDRPFFTEHRAEPHVLNEYKGKRLYSKSGKRFGFIMDVIVLKRRGHRAKAIGPQFGIRFDTPKLQVLWTDRVRTSNYATDINIHKRPDGHYQLSS